MKISKGTMDVLKNYSEINQSIVIKEGNEIKTISALKNILSRAVVKENFPKDFAIYDLPTFIGFHSTMSEPEFEFNDASMTMKDSSGNNRHATMVTKKKKTNSSTIIIIEIRFI